MADLLACYTWDGSTKDWKNKKIPTVKIRKYSETHFLVLIESEYYQNEFPRKFCGGVPVKDGSFDGLWEYEVVELFIADVSAKENPEKTPYLELEFSPHGAYLCLQLHGTRNCIKTGLKLEYYSQICGNVWTGAAIVPKSYLPSICEEFRCNAYSIFTEICSDERTYCCAAPVPGPYPDFHRIHLFPIYKLNL